MGPEEEEGNAVLEVIGEDELKHTECQLPPPHYHYHHHNLRVSSKVFSSLAPFPSSCHFCVHQRLLLLSISFSLYVPLKFQPISSSSFDSLNA